MGGACGRKTQTSNAYKTLDGNYEGKKPLFLLILESIWVHSALRPLIGLLCQPRVFMMVKLVEWLAGEIEVLGENLPQCRFCSPKTTHAARTRTRVAAVGSQRLTA
jgi:hypothetical protein